MTPIRSRKHYLQILLITVLCGCVLLAGAYFVLVSAFPPVRLATLIGEQVKRSTGRELHINGDLTFRLLPTLAVIANDVALSNEEWGSRPEMITLKHVAFEIALRPLLDGKIQILSVLMDGGDTLFESDDKGRSNWSFGRKSGIDGDSDTRPVIDIERLTLSGLQITYRNGDHNKSHRVSIVKLELKRQGDQFQLDASLEVEGQRWQINGKVGALSELSDDKTGWPFDLRFVTDGVNFSAKGLIHTGFVRADITAQINSPDALSAISAGQAVLPIPLEIRTTLVRTADGYRAAPLRLLHAGQEVNGEVTVSGSGATMHVVGQFSSPVFDVGKWLPGKTASVTIEKGQSAIFDDSPLPFQTLPSIPLELEFRIGKLFLHGAPSLSTVSGYLKSRPDLFEIDDLNLMVMGGQIAGRLAVAQPYSSAPRTVLVVDAKGLSVENLSGPEFNFRSGRVDIKANLTLTGVTPRQLAASANGDFLLTSTNIGVKEAVSPERGPVSSLMHALIPEQHAGHGMDITCVAVRLPLRHGLAKINRSIAIETRELAITAFGEVDLARQTLSLAFKPAVKKGINFTQSNLLQLVTLKGPLQAPEIGIDPIGTVREATNLGVAVATGGLSLLAERTLSTKEDIEACRHAIQGTNVQSPSPKAVQRKQKQPVPFLDGLRN